MVVGIDRFREYFAGYEDRNAIIGGTACDLLFNAAGIDFRATRDIDMVLCVEMVVATFGERLGAFLEQAERDNTLDPRQFDDSLARAERVALIRVEYGLGL